MNNSNPLAHNSILQFRHNFSEDKQYFYNEFTRIAGDEQLLVILWIETFGFWRLDTILIVKIENYLFNLLVNGVVVDDFLTGIAISDQQVGGNGW